MLHVPTIRPAYTITMICCLLLCDRTGAIAQSRRSLRCPRPRKEKSYLPQPSSFFEFSAGAAKAFMYRNTAGPIGDHFRFGARPQPVISVAANVVLSPSFGVQIGAQYTQSVQGLIFHFSEDGKTFSERGYSSASLLRYTLGATYYFTDAISVTASPYLCLNICYSKEYSSSSNSFTVSNSTQQLNVAQWADAEFDTRFYTGLSLTGSVRITPRFSLNVQCAADFGASAPTAGYVEFPQAGNNPVVFHGQVKPWLAYAGITAGYRLWKWYR